MKGNKGRRDRKKHLKQQLVRHQDQPDFIEGFVRDIPTRKTRISNAIQTIENTK